jgi:hypothetical protein
MSWPSATKLNLSAMISVLIVVEPPSRGAEPTIVIGRRFAAHDSRRMWS